MQIGDIVTGYHKGFHRITDIRRRFFTERDFFWKEASDDGYYSIMGKKVRVGDEYSPLVSYQQIAKDDFTPVENGRIKSCDAGYCRVITAEWLEQRARELQHNIEVLLQKV